MATTTTTGASATVDPDRPPPLPLDSIPIIDLSLLSQSELFSLSMCSNSSFDRNRCDDVVIPKIDRSVFNESAGSRKQTYSRLRLAPAQSSTSTKTTIHRRTPRLRSSHTPTPNNINDAEQAENSQIIRMLKELFKSDHSFGELVPFEVELDTNVVVPESLNPETNRKRGRPRRQDDAVFIDSPDAKRMRNNTVKKVVAYDAVGDIEMVNSRGVKVNLENLGMLEDPYGLEIRRRTEGLSTKDELLGFLGGLNGEWGTSTKKRKVVDASYFGDALPKGWKLSLSIKKRSDLVWLFCRRYISPSGMQFESFKEVSMYLLSLLGEKNLDKPTLTPSNNRHNFGSKGASMNKDVSVRVDTRRSRPIVLALSSRDFKKEVKSNIVDPIDIKVEEFFKCLKCFIIFEGKVDLFDHQVLAHKTERSQLDSAVSEWNVVKGGIFECQFCNTTFNKRNQYNEHIGTHETNETQTCEASEAPTAEKTVDPVLFTEVPENVVMETDNAPFGDKLISASPQSDHKISSATESEVNEHVHDLNILDNDNKGEHVNMNEDVSVEESGGEIEKETDDAPFGDKLISVSPQSDQKISSGTESEFNDHVHELNILDHDNQGEHVNMNEDVSAEESSGAIEKETDDAPFDDKLISASPQSDHKIISGTESEFNDDVRDLNMNEDVLVEESGGEIEKKCHEGENEFLERDKSSDVSESKSDFSLGHEASIDESSGKLESCVVTVDCIDDNCNKGLDDSIDIVEKDIVGISNGEDAHVDENPECILEKGISSENSPLLQSTNELLDSIEKDSVEVLNLADSEIRVQPSSKICEEKGFQENINICSPFDDLTSEKEELINEDRVAEVNKLFDSETLFLDSSHNTSLKDSPQKLGFDFDEDRFCYGRVEDIGNKSKGEEPETQMIMEEFELENDVIINNASSLNRSTEVNLDDFQIPSLGSSQNDLNLEFCSLVPTGNQQEFSFQDDDVTGIYENAHEGSERGLLDHFSITETSVVSDDIFGNSSSYSTPLDAFKFDEERDIHELSLNFGNSSSHGIGLYENTVNLNQKKDDVQTNLTMVNINNEIETQGFAHNNANMVYPQVVANQQQSGNGVFRVDERSSSSSSRSEPVEFRFLTGRSQHIMNPHRHHLQGASSGVFPYNNNNNNTGIIGMDQGFGSGFWSGKNGMGGRNVITGVCAWCRNEFHMQQPEVQGQGGGIGSLCPNCSGQVNML
ncbi:unnamed protein product [Lactuca virosa]|uniref:C2H2-type domain-containing protein n=1 Tax=Lactuca virosa TaxID=75947 RepID=A0AAU9N595_9ASTR|nr:unnamed protein product [Lactuca virosa]